jgi:hypothetical protein
MDKFFVNIIILLMLNYFQLLYGYFSLIKILSPYIIYGYSQKNWLFCIISPSAIFGYFRLFHLKLFLAIISFFDYSMLFFGIVNYFNLGYL